MPPASRVPPPPERHQTGAREEAYLVDTILNQLYRRHVSNDCIYRVDSQLIASIDDESGPTHAEKTPPPIHTPKIRFRRESCVKTYVREPARMEAVELAILFNLLLFIFSPFTKPVIVECYYTAYIYLTASRPGRDQTLRR